MAARAGTKIVRKAKTVLDNVLHPPYLSMYIPAQLAKPAPPLGPHLGKPDRSYVLEMESPPEVYLLRLAAGARKGSANPGAEVCGRITLKHIYHIAELKQKDLRYAACSLESICKKLIGIAHRLGLEVLSQEDLSKSSVDHSPSGYANFLQERERFLVEKKREADVKKQARLMRIS